MPITLTYHDVVAAEVADSSGFPGPLAARYKLSPDHFEAHLNAFKRLGSTVGTNLFSPADLTLTFDDGGGSATYIADQLESHGWRGCFFVVSSLIGEDGFLNRNEIADLHNRGHCIGSHSHTHPTYMGKLDPQALNDEWSQSREAIAEITGAAPVYASIPGGFSSASVFESAEASGYQVLFTSEPNHRLRRVGNLTVSGRYSIWATTAADRAAAYVSGNAWARRKLALEWKLKQSAKRLHPSLYERLRRLRAADL